MDPRIARILGLPAEGGGGTAYSGMFSGLPEPLANPSAPTYSAGGLGHNLASPYRGMSGVVLPDQQQTATNPGEVDPALAATLKAGDAGWIDRGANAFLGGGYNPWGMEFTGDDGGSGYRAPAQQGNDIANLFEIAGQLGMDTSKYTRNPGRMGMRGERSGEMDAMQLYDDFNDYTKDYVSVGGLSQGWSGGPENTSARTLYKEVDGRLIPVAEPMFHANNPDKGFFSDEFKGALSTVGLAALGGWLAAPAAAGGTAAGAGGASAAASGTAGAGAAGGAATSGLSSAWSQLPQWGQRALTGALQGGLSSGIQGGNILQGALMGGVQGGAGSVIGDTVKGLNLGLPEWASRGVSGALTGGLSSALRGGDVLSGALSGGVSGGLQGAGVPSGIASLGGRLAGSALSGDTPSGSLPGATPGASMAAIGGSLPSGSSTAVEQLFDPNDARQRYLVNALRLNRSGKAGDQSEERSIALRKALEELV